VRYENIQYTVSINIRISCTCTVTIFLQSPRHSRARQL
jgi:hypothetical protein